jgi:hypothetical protein
LQSLRNLRRLLQFPPPSRHDRIHCPLTTLDEQFVDQPETFLGIVKIDVEGFETAVIQGAARLLAEDRIAFVYAEVIPQALREAGSSAAELLPTLAAANLVPVRFGTLPESTFTPCSLPEALDAAPVRAMFYSLINLFCITDYSN